MTFLEKAIEEEKDSSLGLRPQEITTIYCPSSYGFEDGRKCDATDKAKCVECWNREMPNTEAKDKRLKNEDDVLHSIAEANYNKGFEDGMERGLNDAWELVKKIKNLYLNEQNIIFENHSRLVDILDNFTPQEALAKMKAYEEQSEIKVGNVVVDLEKQKGIVVGVMCGEDKVEVWFDGYNRAQIMSTRHLTKTDKHLDIKSILEQIGE